VTLTLPDLEKSLKEALITEHKRRTGIGPRQAYVKVFHNTAFARLSGFSTHLEQDLSRRGERQSAVRVRREINDILIEAQTLMPITGTRLVDILYYVDYDKDATYMLLVFADDLDPSTDTPDQPSAAEDGINSVMVQSHHRPQVEGEQRFLKTIGNALLVIRKDFLRPDEKTLLGLSKEMLGNVQNHLAGRLTAWEGMKEICGSMVKWATCHIHPESNSGYILAIHEHEIPS
jgi:uncharacterized protein YbcI